MKIHEIITEAKVEASKPRNFVAKNAKMGGAGQHKDKKKAEKQGDVKHKNKQVAEGALNEGKGLVGELAGFLKSNGFKGPYRLGKLPKWAAELSEFGKDDLIMVQGNDVEYDEFVVDIGYGILYWGAEGGMTKMTEKAIMNHVQQGVAEGSVKELSMDLKTLSDAEFQAQYKMTKAQARAGLQGKFAVKETATAGSTSAGNVAVGAVYKNKKAKMQKPGTNALDMKGTNLLTGGSIKR